MGLLSLFLDPRDRIGRQQYWLGMLGVVAAILALLGVVWSTGQFWLSLPLIVFIMGSVYVLGIKRLHDRNRSGWWTLLFITLPGGLDRMGNRFPEDSPEWWLLALLAFAFSLWGLIEMGFRRGSPGDNDYGPGPAMQDNVASQSA
jgi:uncharacterized membrane protein YhaH (DUF805 family)